MKKVFYIAATAFLCASCFHVNSNFKGFEGGGKTVRGEGAVVTKSFDLKDFDAIVISGRADAVFHQSSDYEVSLTTQENIFDCLDYRVDGTTLVIEAKDKASIDADTYRLVIQAPALYRIEVNGAADIEVSDLQIPDKDLVVEVNGAGELEFDKVVCKDFSIEANGAADVSARTISVQNLDIEVNGAGDVELSGSAENASLEVNGAGDIDAEGLKVSGKIDKRVSGLASINL